MQTAYFYDEKAIIVSNVQHTKMDADWKKYTNSDEEQRLIVLEARIERKKRILQDAFDERKTIMARAIKRMRRANGKA